MSRKTNRRTQFEDLDPYEGCPADAGLGILPLGVGWLSHNQPFVTGDVAKFPAGFVEKLLVFCDVDFVVNQTSAKRPCPICRQKIQQYGGAETRILGESDIFATPDLIHHYVTAHNYRPPDDFVKAVLYSPEPSSAEHRALRKFYGG
jgi:hypothetical protein